LSGASSSSPSEIVLDTIQQDGHLPVGRWSLVATNAAKECRKAQLPSNLGEYTDILVTKRAACFANTHHGQMCGADADWFGNPCQCTRKANDMPAGCWGVQTCDMQNNVDGCTKSNIMSRMQETEMQRGDKETMTIDEETLDPTNWEQARALAHRMVDDAIDYLQTVRERPVWQAMPPDVVELLQTPLPIEPTGLETVYQRFLENVLPYPMGNIHPRFWMWYMGSSNFTGAMGDFLAAILGSNLGGGNHAAALIDRQVVDWCKQMVGFPASASGTLVSGGSMANIICLTVARNVMAGINVRKEGIGAVPQPLKFYSSDQVHSCHQKGLEVLGLGRVALHKVSSNEQYQLDIQALKEAIRADRAAGGQPVCVIANAGAVNTGAIDDLEAIADLCREEKLWYHVDGCIGALLAIAPQNRHLVAGLERADSVALDPHKWLHAPFEVGCAVVKDASAHLHTFTLTPEYLEMTQRGIASAKWLYDYGMQTSRGFRALKVWLSLQEHGVQKFGRLIDQNIAQAGYLSSLIEGHPRLELVTPTKINIVCFRYNPGNLDEESLKQVNTEIMIRLQESGVAAISDTTLRGRHCLRAAINNHRTRQSDLDLLVAEVVRIGATVLAEQRS
jgi:glutamate/tyrosine decarboxylase-like PLP-dependent enzyme